jgi:hypothetical protein
VSIAESTLHQFFLLCKLCCGLLRRAVQNASKE